MLPIRVAISDEFGKRPDAHRDVEPLFDQIDDPIDEEQPVGDAREGIEKRDHDGDDMENSEHRRCGDRDLSPRLAVLPGKGELHRFKLGEDATAGFEIVTAWLGEREMPRGAGHETHPDLLLERRELAADRGQGHAQMSSRRR